MERKRRRNDIDNDNNVESQNDFKRMRFEDEFEPQLGSEEFSDHDLPYSTQDRQNVQSDTEIKRGEPSVRRQILPIGDVSRYNVEEEDQDQYQGQDQNNIGNIGNIGNVGNIDNNNVHPSFIPIILPSLNDRPQEEDEVKRSFGNQPETVEEYQLRRLRRVCSTPGVNSFVELKNMERALNSNLQMQFNLGNRPSICRTLNDDIIRRAAAKDLDLQPIETKYMQEFGPFIDSDQDLKDIEQFSTTDYVDIQNERKYCQRENKNLSDYVNLIANSNTKVPRLQDQKNCINQEQACNELNSFYQRKYNQSVNDPYSFINWQNTDQNICIKLDETVHPIIDGTIKERQDLCESQNLQTSTRQLRNLVARIPQFRNRDNNHMSRKQLCEALEADSWSQIKMDYHLPVDHPVMSLEYVTRNRYRNDIKDMRNEVTQYFAEQASPLSYFVNAHGLITEPILQRDGQLVNLPAIVPSDVNLARRFGVYNMTPDYNSRNAVRRELLEKFGLTLSSDEEFINDFNEKRAYLEEEILRPTVVTTPRAISQSRNLNLNLEANGDENKEGIFSDNQNSNNNVENENNREQAFEPLGYNVERDGPISFSPTALQPRPISPFRML